MDLKTKLAFALVSVSLLSMGALGYLTYRWAEESFLAESERRLTAVADGAEGQVGEVVAGWKRELSMLLSRAGSPAELGASSTEAQLAATTRVLGDALALSDDMVGVALFDGQGEPLFGSQHARPDLAISLPDESLRYAGLKHGSDDSLSVMFQAQLRVGASFLGTLEAAFDGRALAGALGPREALGISGKSRLLLPMNPGVPDGEALILEGTSAAEGPALRRSASPASEAAGLALRGHERALDGSLDERGEAVMAATRFMPELGWGIVVQVDRAEARDRVDQLLVNMRDIGLSLAAFAILGGTLFGLYLGRPIAKLVQDVDRIRHGEVGVRLEVNGEDEAAFLAMSLNEFMDQLDRSSDLFRLGELNILVVDGDSRRRHLLEELLRNWHMLPIFVESGAAASSALSKAGRAGRALQLLLLDDSVLDLEDTEWARQLRSSTGDPFPIILLSDDPEALDAEGLERAGIERVLPKPLVASHLMEAILDQMGVSPTSTTDVYLRKTAPRRILLAEDNFLIQRVMVEFLTNWGHAVKLAENGRAAVDLFRQEYFDLVLMDVVMPEMDGLEATGAIREHEQSGGRRTPIVALTAEAMSIDRSRCLEAGMDDYLSKPVDPKALYAMIERWPVGESAREPTEMTEPMGHPVLEETRAEPDEASVDWELARSLTGDDTALIEELVGLFPGESRQHLAAMRSAIDSGDAQLLTRSAHTLKSSARIFGASELVDAALSMEALGEQADLGRASGLLATLERETDRLNRTLGRAATHGLPQA